MPTVPVGHVCPGAILEPGQTTMRDFNRDTRIPHRMFMTFVSFPEVLDRQDPNSGKALRFFEECRAVGAVPVLTLETFGGLDAYRPGHVVEFADFLSGFSTPMILRWNHEMNGSWYPWGQQPARYVAKFREFADVIHARAPGVAMAWTPNQGWGYPWPMCDHHNPTIPGGDPYAPYYPGDEFADWVGFSFYHWGEERGSNQTPRAGKWAQANGIGNPVPNIHDVYAKGRGKPMMIAETSALFDTGNSRNGGATEAEIKIEWIRQVYGLARASQPCLKAIFWFNILKYEAEVKGDVDWRINAHPRVAEHYSRALSDPYFIKGPPPDRSEPKTLASAGT